MKKTANFATYPGQNRLEAISESVRSIIDQVDLVRICWNQYHFESIPRDLFYNPKIFNFFPETDYTDNGKFIFLELTKNEPEFYFTCDDDIRYSSGYIDHSISELGTHAIGTHHGRVLNPQGAYSYYRGKHKPYSYLNTTPENAPEYVNVGGTGVMVINTSLYCPHEVAHSPYKLMSDLVLSHRATLDRIPIKLLRHKEGLCRHIPVGQQTIANKFREEESKQVELLKKILLSLGLYE